MPWHQHTRRCWEDLKTVLNCTSFMSNTIYHISPTQFRRRTSMLGLPDSVYRKYEDVCHKCRVFSTSIAPPRRARVSGIRASNFGDVIFVNHAEIMLRSNKYMVLLVLDGATNLLWATAQSSLNKKDTIQCLRCWTDDNNCMPKAIVGDEAFFQEDFLTYYRTHSIKECPCGSRTPWPNRAETAVRLFKRQWQLMTRSLEDDLFKGVPIREAIKRTETLNSPLVVTHLWKFPLVEDHLIFLTLKQLTQLSWVLNIYFYLTLDLGGDLQAPSESHLHQPIWDFICTSQIK